MAPLDSSYIGIAVSVTGNILISVSLNTQKLAHERLAKDHNHARQHSRQDELVDTKINRRKRTASENTPLLSKAQSTSASVPDRHSGNRKGQIQVYSLSTVKNNDDNNTQPTANGHLSAQVLPHPAPIVRSLAEQGAPIVVQDTKTGRIRRKWLTIRGRKPSASGASMVDNIKSSSSVEPSTPQTPLLQGTDSALPERGRDRIKLRSRKSSTRERKARNANSIEGQYVYKSKLWWLGLCLMALGELGNFTSYAFAPASVVAPLGTTALIANCFIAPCMLHEKFRKKDILGIGFSIVGAVTVVLSSKSENKSLTPHQFLHAVSQPAFIIYSIISLAFIVVLLGLSRTRAGDRYVAVDIGLCAFCGGFTVLSVKAFSSFLTQNFVDCFKQWPTYPVLAVLAVTAIMQIIFLNRALQRFESRVVVPTQFVSFTISAITGSAILYRDFEDVQIGKVVAFFLGCALVFSGVVILTSSKSSTDDQSTSDMIDIPGDIEARPRDGSRFSISSLDSQGQLEGVALTSSPPGNTTNAYGSMGRHPVNFSNNGRGLRKYKSSGTLPSRSTTLPINNSSAHATPIKTGRPPSLTATKVFSPGYLLIAGPGLSNMSSSSNSSSGSISDFGDIDEAMNGHTVQGDENLDTDMENGINVRPAGGLETLMEGIGSSGSSGNVSQANEEEGEEGHDEPMTRSALMRRSGTV